MDESLAAGQWDALSLRSGRRVRELLRSWLDALPLGTPGLVRVVRDIGEAAVA